MMNIFNEEKERNKYVFVFENQFKNEEEKKKKISLSKRIAPGKRRKIEIKRVVDGERRRERTKRKRNNK